MTKQSKQSNKLPTPPNAPEPQPAPQSPPQPTVESVKDNLASARARRLKLQGKAYKDNDDKLKLLALDVLIGQLLLRLDDLA